MANSSLQGYSWDLPDELHSHLKRTMNVDGYKRLNGLINEPKVSYEQLKRIKNFFDNHSTAGVDYMDDKKQDTEFILNGSRKMRDWVNRTLGTARDNISKVKDVQKNSSTAIDNTHIKSHTKAGFTTNSIKPHSTSDIKIKKESYDDIYIRKEVKLMESLINIFDKNKELWQTDNKSHQF